MAAGDPAAGETAGGWKQEAGRLAAMVAGLNAVVWERDPETLAMRWISDRIVELLGYPLERWYAEPDLWQRVLHPDDRERAVGGVRAAVAEGHDFALSYRAIAADGRLLWLRHLGHVALDADGRPTALHAVVVDVTADRRREQAARVSAGAGSHLSGAGPLADRLHAVTELLVGEVCDQAAIWLRDDDGRHSAVAASPATYAEQLLTLAPVHAPAELVDAFERAEPYVLETVTGEMVRAATDGGAQFAAASAAAPSGPMLATPFRHADGPVLGTLTMELRAGSRRHDDDDLALAADLGRRLAGAVSGHRAGERQRWLHDLSVALSAAVGIADAAAALARGVQEALAATLVTVCTLGEDGVLRPVETVGLPPERLERFAAMRLSASLPLTLAARTRTAQWLPDRRAWFDRFPEIAGEIGPLTEAAAAIPLIAGDRVVGAVGVTFRTPRAFDPDTRAFLLTLASQAAVAIDRATLADLRGEIAETLQRSLLPRSLPRLDRLAVTARYLPGVRGTRAGGDWYDVLPRGDGRVALAVGDVVGEGAPAAAVMGQLRSALAGYLLEGHEPDRALDLLDRFARTVTGASVSTVTCLLLDPVTGDLLHASAGHPPPLVLDDDGVRFLADGAGPALALPAHAVHRQARTTLAPGSTLLLYTDGLVERRQRTLDDGLALLAEVVTSARADGIDGLADTVLDGLVGGGRTDDVALVAARLVPAPLEMDFAADPARLRDVRAGLRRWAASAALDQDTTDDLLLAVGEAAANAVEHAYGGAHGPVRVVVGLVDGRRVEGTIADEGRWRPVPADPGFRGRGLSLLRELATTVDLDQGPGGTVVRFAMDLPSTGGPAAAGEPAREGDPAAVDVTEQDGVRCLRLTGDLDLAGVAAVRSLLLAALAGDGAVVLDLRDLASAASSGLGLLLEVAGRRGSTPVDVLLPDAGPVRRALDLTGLTGQLRPPGR